jgi:hypothetical protein
MRHLDVGFLQSSDIQCAREPCAFGRDFEEVLLQLMEMIIHADADEVVDQLDIGVDPGSA